MVLGHTSTSAGACCEQHRRDKLPACPSLPAPSKGQARLLVPTERVQSLRTVRGARPIRFPPAAPLCLLLAAMLTNASLLAEGVSQLVEKGNQAYREERYQEAVEAYREALEKRPSAEVQLNLGHCYVQLKKFPEAAEAYQAALKEDPQVKDGEWLLARALYGAERYQDAIRHFWQAAPQKREAFLWIGQAHTKLGDLIAAETVYRDGAARHPGYRDVREALAVLYVGREEFGRAAEVYAALSKSYPDDTKLKTRLAEVRVTAISRRASEAYDEERFSKAAALYEEAVAILPSAELFVNLGHCRLHAEDYPKAAEAYRKALAIDAKRKEINRYLGRALFAAGEFEGATGPLQDALKASPNSEIALLLGQTHERRGDLKAAEAVYRGAAGEDLKKLGPAEALAVLYVNTERYAEAVKVYEALGRHFPEKASLRERLTEVRAVWYARQGNEAFGKGEYGPATRHFEASLKEMAKADTFLNLGHTYTALQRYEDAIKAYRGALTLDRKRVEVYWPLAQALYQSGDHEEAIRSFRQSLDEARRAEAYLLTGKCYELLESPASARTAYEEGAVRFPASLPLREALAALYIKTGRPELAAEIYTSLTKKRPGDAQLLKNLAQVQLSTGNADKALDTLEMVRRLAPDDASVYQSLADIYLSRDMYREASEMYRLLLPLTEKPSAEDYFRLAHAYFRGDELVSAKEALNKTLELDKAHASAWLYLGHLAAREDDPKSAESAYRKALETGAGLEAAHLALANLFLRRKDYAGAAQHYRKVLDKRATPVTYRNAIIALVRSGEEQAARTVLKEARRHYPGHKDLADLAGLFDDDRK